MENPLYVSIFLFLCILIQSSAHGQKSFGRRSRAAETNKISQETRTRFLLFRGETDKGCQIRLNHSDTLQQCGFNSSLPLVMIVHGWLVDGILEDWIWEMVAALKSQLAQPVNVGLAEWVTLAHNHYTTAVRNTRLVGQEIAALLQWLQESVQFSPSHVHLIGYSLGAHVSGFAGSYMSRKHKIGRITGLDKALPSVVSPRLSNISSPCSLLVAPDFHDTRFFSTLLQTCHGLLLPITQTVKCAHERSVHLFIDSLLHADMQSTAYLCRDMDSFSQGLCLSCKKGRCNTLGYHTRQEWQSKKSKSLFLVTRAQSPFKVYHYQFKIRFINQTENPVEPTFTVSFLGTRGERQKIPITLSKGITSNETYSFLITLDVDIGELIMIKFKWENSMVWSNVWNTVQTIIPWRRESLRSGLALKSIRVKVGETQQRMTFCSENMNDLVLHPAREKTFVRCEANSETLKRKIR
uniref:Hepatic triacylglycerol lipase n=1 Tax=Capra hircus TaxID=9925 RepID=A0A8C2NZ12_CAPHI